MNGNRLRDLEGHVMDVYKCRFFPSGLVILSGGIDMSVRVWSVETGTCPRTFKGHTSGWYLGEKSFDNSREACFAAVSDLAIIGVGREVLSCSHDGTIVKWLCQDGSVQEQWRPEAGPCNAIAISSDFTMFAVACEERKCVVYSVSGPMLSTIATDNVPTAVCIDCDYYHIVYIGDEQGMVSVYDAKTKSFICRLKTDRAGVIKIMAREEGLFVAFSSVIPLTVVVVGDGSMCCYARDFSPNEVCPLYEFTGSDCDPIYDFCFNKKHLFTACRDGVVRRYRIP
ncbi:unnamed protein product [Nippostrongylus brasiliensis]|uniref:WD_REPEATS_REGION domain-containing protein n=1 Tax=Nippostrongylus brasiliensis TaxID=27835 RepID=A0A0N4Y183_NIPBR|nr:unnamed protein product [Nippostrongylus brasiliensis]